MSPVVGGLLLLASVLIPSKGFMTGGGPTYSVAYEPVGCFKDNNKLPRPLPDLIGDFRDIIEEIGLNRTIGACAVRTKRKGFKYFGLQFYGQCWSGPNGQKTFANNGKSIHCNGGVGLAETNFVYKLVKKNTTPPLGAKIRLVGGRTNREGRVETQWQGKWGTICGNKWDLRDANVVCKMLNYNTALLAGGIPVGPGKGPVLMDEVECEGHETSLANCHSVTPGNQEASQQCKHPAVAVCRIKPAAPTGIRLPVRLVGGRGRHEGRVEVFHRRAWGTVCDEDWDLNDATVVCRSLGFPGALEASGQAKYGKGKGQIWLTRVRCTGEERLIHNCAHEQWGNTACSHDSDAGVRCRAGRG